MALNNVKLPDKTVVERASRNVARVMSELNRILVGRPELHKLVVTGILSQGHILLEGLPGVGKTALIKTLGELFGLKFSRVQFTPDLMPGDILGSHILQQSEDGSRQMTFQPGPIFTNILLADETVSSFGSNAGKVCNPYGNNKKTSRSLFCSCFAKSN